MLLVDREGIPALSMRRLAGELGVKAMSLYHHVPNKGALLEELLQRMFGAIVLPTNQDLPWQGQMRRVMHSFRSVGLEHPHVFRLYATPAGDLVRFGRSVDVEILKTAGFDDQAAHFALRTLTSFVLGFVSRELESAAGDAIPGDRSKRRRMDPANSEKAFDFGLDAVLVGLDSKLP